MTHLIPKGSYGGLTAAELVETAKQWDLYDASVEGWRARPPSYTEVRYDNWWGSGATLRQLHGLAKDHGIPVAWVPPADVLRELVKADDAHRAKLAVLTAAEERIRTSCRYEIPELHAGWSEDYAVTVRHVMAAWDDGHLLAAGCLALAGSEDLMLETAEVDRKRSKSYKRLQQAAVRDLEESLWLHEQVALTPIGPLFTKYMPEDNDPIPEALSRHAVVHRMPLDHFNDGHCIVAIMLMVSLLREMEERRTQAQVSSLIDEGRYGEDLDVEWDREPDFDPPD
ncbi:hypothetical protein G4Z16_13890 [Streptomyces bathyalis]|uniref:Uncharacterized protein n=1 Tax=Streptomyces bathyalis TaxID=2710756 RepID=A0A7T1T6J1_9ACTN|nr:hypothetical protein [Streptomyces bathyalis]QPP07297.1 hypothetical protein G4Z16_13890 [Streptomyces bathyalis]